MKFILSFFIILMSLPLFANSSDENSQSPKPSVYELYQLCMEDLMDNWGLTFEQAEKRCAHYLDEDEAGSQTLHRSLEQLKIALNDQRVPIVWVAVGTTLASRWLFLKSIQNLVMVAAKRSVPAIALIPPDLLQSFMGSDLKISLPQNNEYPLSQIKNFLDLPRDERLRELRSNKGLKKYLLELHQMIEVQKDLILYRQGLVI